MAWPQGSEATVAMPMPEWCVEKKRVFKEFAILHSDGELVNAVLEGDRAAFEELVVRYERAVQAVCQNVLNDRHLAADAAQEAFVLAYRKMGTLKNATAFAP